MTTKLLVWTDEQAKQELSKRLAYAKQARKKKEVEWKDCERILFGTDAHEYSQDPSTVSQGDTLDWEAQKSKKALSVNYAFKNFRFIHSQMSANPPTVIPRPTSNDPSDRKKADAADRLVRHGIRQYKMQERIDLVTASTLQYGTGVGKCVFDPDLGDILDFDEETDEVLMEGDITINLPSVWDIFLDPDANTQDELKWVFERQYMPYEEACYRFADKSEILKKFRIQEASANDSDERNKKEQKYDVVEVFQYWEKGLPHNGMVGRFCYLTREGDLLTPIRPSPHRFTRPKDGGLALPSVPPEENAAKVLPGRAQLPYLFLTDIDVPGEVWGRSVLLYEAPLQDLHNQMINVMVDTLEAHGVPRIILPEGTELAEDSITNTPWDVIKITGNQAPHFMEPMPMPAAFGQLLQLVKTGIDDMAGVNEAMFGQQSREQSGFSMQYATNQGNLIRRRLFNKYVIFVEALFKSYLNLCRKHWSEGRIITVLGKEKAFEAIEVKGSDIDGGYDLVVEYGASLSLDPTSRREEIITLMPMFKEAGIPVSTALGLMKLNELDGLYDRTQLAADRQRETFAEMQAGDKYIAPEIEQDHPGMLQFCNEYVMTSEYKYLPPEAKVLIKQHIQDRKQMAQQQQQPPAAPGQGGQGAPPQPGQMPPLPGPTPQDQNQAAPMNAKKG